METREARTRGGDLQTDGGSRCGDQWNSALKTGRSSAAGWKVSSGSAASGFMTTRGQLEETAGSADDAKRVWPGESEAEMVWGGAGGQHARCGRIQGAAKAPELPQAEDSSRRS